MKLQSKKVKFTVSVQVVNVICQCGGDCVNEQGSIMIDLEGVWVKCELCGETYKVSPAWFKTRSL